ncbi:MAG: hypothetical protein ABIQ95_11085 [Bdellovibrionia bacterium]
MLITVGFLLALNGLISQSLATSCEEKFRIQPSQFNEHVLPSGGLTKISPYSSHVSETDILKNNGRNLANPLIPHAHKMDVGQKYHGSTSETFRLEGLKKKKKFHEFFQKNFPEIKLPQTEMDFWSHLKITNPKNFQIAISAAKALEVRGYPLSGFIYIVNPNLSISIAPRTIINGKDTGDAKHIGLANGDSILASGELDVQYFPEKHLRYNLKSGTYMAALKEPEQFNICIEMKNYLVELTKFPTEFSEAF